MEDNFDCDKDYAKCGGWMSSKDYESKNMSGSSHSSDSHGVYSAYSAGNLRSSEKSEQSYHFSRRHHHGLLSPVGGQHQRLPADGVQPEERQEQLQDEGGQQSRGERPEGCQQPHADQV